MLRFAFEHKIANLSTLYGVIEPNQMRSLIFEILNVVVWVALNLGNGRKNYVFVIYPVVNDRFSGCYIRNQSKAET